MELTAEQKIEKALDIAFQYSQIDGAHHKAWSIDQMVRALTGDNYNQWVKDYEYNEDDPDDGWEWDTGISP